MKRLYMLLLPVILLAGCGGGGSSGPTTPSLSEPPTLSLIADKSEIYLGQSVKLTWYSSNTNGCSASWSGTEPSNGTASIIPTSAGIQNYKMTCTGQGGKAIADTSVKVNSQQVDPSSLALNPAALNFGNVTIGSNGKKIVTISNIGSVPVTIQSITVGGANSNEFSISDVTLPFPLSGNATATFSTTFTPAASGTAYATVSVNSNATNSPQNMNVSGNGIAYHYVSLTWIGSPSDDGGATCCTYKMYRGTISGGPYTLLESIGRVQAYTDYSVLSGETWYYVITAENISGSESAYSNESPAVIPTP